MLFSLSVLLSVLSVAHAASPPCNHVFKSPKATFDLTPLSKKGAHYFTEDAYGERDRPFYYYFNVCADTEEANLPLPEADKELCRELNPKASAAAYQLVNATADFPHGQCLKLGDSEEMDWALIDGDDSMVGVEVTYRGGDKCEGDKFRSFSVQFKCIEEGTALPPVSTVVEDDMCRYRVTVETIHGCPRQCHQTKHDRLCNGHGLCAIDENIKEARCFCNKGKGGVNCEDDVDESTGSSPNSVLVAFVIILLVALLGVAAVLYLKIKKLNQEDNPYGAFEDQMPNTMSLNA